MAQGWRQDPLPCLFLITFFSAIFLFPAGNGGHMCPEKPLTWRGKAANSPQQGLSDTYGRRRFHILPAGPGGPHRPLPQGTGEAGHGGTGRFRPHRVARRTVCGGPVHQQRSGNVPHLGGDSPSASPGIRSLPAGDMGRAQHPVRPGKGSGAGRRSGRPGTHRGTAERAAPHCLRTDRQADRRSDGKFPE